MKWKIKGLEIGEEQPCRIVAELGTLNLLDMDDLWSAVKEAFQIGADMVKVQAVNWRTAWWASEGQIGRYKTLEEHSGIGPDKPVLDDFLRDVNKEFAGPVFSSIFDRCFITERFLKYSPAVKLGWKTNAMPALIEEVFKRSNTPVVWSMNGLEYWRYGMEVKSQDKLYDREATVAPRVAKLAFHERTIRLFVQTLYPVPEEKQMIPRFESLWHGISAHSSDEKYLRAALAMGAKMMEVHCALGKAEGPDTAFALDSEKLKRLVDLKKKWEIKENGQSEIPVSAGNA